MKIGSHDAIPPFDWKPRKLSPQPHWKTATSTPYAAPTESRLRTIAFTAITIDRNETRSRMNAKTRTKPNTIGAFCFSKAFSSADCAVGPVTAYVAPDTLPTVAGRTSFRSVSSAALETESAPLPASGIETRATVCDGFTSTTTGPCIRPLARSEEHTSELQSPYDLVCRILLEKKQQH